MNVILIITVIVYIGNPSNWVVFGDFRNVFSIYPDTRYVWVASDGGVVIYDKLFHRWRIPHTRTPFPSDIKIMIADASSGDIWFVTKSLLGSYNPVFQDCKIYNLPEQNPNSIGVMRKYAYVKYDRQIYEFNKFSGEFKRLDGAPAGIVWYPKDSPQNYPFLAPYFVQDRKLKRYYMTSAARDGEDLWVGTQGYGLYKYNIYTYEPTHCIFGPGNKCVNVMLKDGDIFWFGGISGNVITRWDRKNDEWTYFSVEDNYGILSTSITSITATEKYAWFGTKEGVTRYEKSSGDFQTYTVFDGLPSNFVLSLAADSLSLWVGTIQGLVRMEDGNVIEKALSGVSINDILVRDNETWVASSRGVFRKKKKWQPFRDPNGILSLETEKVIEDRGRFFFATKMGLVIYANGKFQRFTYPVYLPGDRIFSITTDSNNIWIGTNNGVIKYDEQMKVGERYTSTNSPLKGDIYSMLVNGKYIYFGTEIGLVRYQYR